MKFYIYTLGCKVNSYESRIMTEDLINAGYVEEKDNNIPADIYIINTCSVTNTADSKSLKLIRQAIKKNKDAIIVVCGCLAQAKPETVNIDGVDIVIGNKNKSKVSEYINEYVKNKNKKTDIYDISNVEFETMKLNNFDKTRAFIKIQDGCNNFCAYCIIPYTRGSVRSKPREDILNEIDHLTLNGHKEIVLTGIHTGNYGSEFDNYDFADLLNEIVKIKKLSRIRISSIEITELNDRVLEIIKNNNCNNFNLINFDSENQFPIIEYEKLINIGGFWDSYKIWCSVYKLYDECQGVTKGAMADDIYYLSWEGKKLNGASKGFLMPASVKGTIKDDDDFKELMGNWLTEKYQQFEWIS